MTAPESALAIAREVAPGLEWFGGETWAEASLLPPSGPRLSLRHGTRFWWSQCDLVAASRSGLDPRACLRAVIGEVHRWALDVARATEVPDE